MANVPKKMDSMGHHVLEMRETLGKLYGIRMHLNDVSVRYLLGTMDMIGRMLSLGSLSLPVYVCYKELMNQGALQCGYLVSELRKRGGQHDWDPPTKSVLVAMKALENAEGACKRAYSLVDSEIAASADEDPVDDSTEGHVYRAFADYGDVEYRSHKDMVEGTKAYCAERGIPYPEGGMVEGAHYDFYETWEEYERVFEDGE